MSHEISEDLRLIDEEGQDPAEPTGTEMDDQNPTGPTPWGVSRFSQQQGDDFSTR